MIHHLLRSSLLQAVVSLSPCEAADAVQHGEIRYYDAFSTEKQASGYVFEKGVSKNFTFLVPIGACSCQRGYWDGR